MDDFLQLVASREISVIYFLDTDDADDADFFNIPIRVIRV